LGVPKSKGQAIAALLGVAVILGTAVPMAQGALSIFWPKVGGVITHSGDLPGRHVTGVDIGYRYAVGGTTYSGNRYRFQFVLSRWNMESRDVQSILGRYRVGEPVMIAVNPGDASDSVLESGIDFESLFPLAAGVVLVLVGLGNFSEAAAAAEMRSSGRPRYRTAAGIALTAIALFSLSAYDLWRGMMSLAWPSVPGRMLYSQARQGSQPETLLWYEYNVNNRRYVASKYRNGGNATPFDSVAQVAAQRYPAGGAVTVYYNPNDPEDALLERGIWWGNFVFGGVSLPLFAWAWLTKRYAEIVAARENS
jgi:hypothetical protein